MSVLTSRIVEIENAYNQLKDLQAKIDNLSLQLRDKNEQYTVMLEAQQLLSSVANSNTNAVLDYITGIINKALSELFPYDTRRIYLDKCIHGGQKPHIKLKMTTSEGTERDLILQSGTGLRQIISFLFVVCLIEIRKGRRILLMDELLNGLHSEAKRVIMDIMRIFADEGFQFIMVEYGVDDVGKIYLVEKPDGVATINALEGEYNNEVFMFNRPIEEVDKSIIETHEDSEDDEKGNLSK